MARNREMQPARGRLCSLMVIFASLCLVLCLVPAHLAIAEADQDVATVQESDALAEQSAAPDELAVPPASEALAMAVQSNYEGGSIPILRITFHDDLDPDTGEVILSGDEKIDLVNEAPNHSYSATGVSIDLEVPPTYDNPESDLWDGVSGYTGETNLELEFIRGRGNSTWRAAKKPYKFKLDKKANLFGMGKNKHWTLIANYYDTSLTVDRLIGWLGDQMQMTFTPRAVPVDLFLNGEYYGNYLLMEEVRVDENRVDIDEVDADESDLDSLEITGDYLLGWNRKPTAFPYEYFLTKRGHAYTWDTPEYGPELNEAEQAQQAYIKAHMERVEDAVYGKNLTNSQGENAWDLIDKYSLADFWWIQEYSTNRDAFATPSTYFYKLRDTVNSDGSVTPGKLYWGPLWDFDFVWGEFPAEGFDTTDGGWVPMLRQDPEFVQLLKERWQVLDGVLEQATCPGGLLDGYIAEMSDSWEANQERWPKPDQYDWPDGSYAETIEKLREHMEARRAWINANLDSLQVQIYSVTFMDGDTTLEEYRMRFGEPAWLDAPDAAEIDDMIFMGWVSADGREYNPNEAYNEDIVFMPQYVDASTVSHIENLYFAVSEQWIDRMGWLSYEIMPEDAVDQRIVWSSSDESVVTVDGSGMLRAVDGCLDGVETARATVTAYLVGSGTSVSIDVVVYDGRVTVLPEPESIEFEPEMTLEQGTYGQVSYTAQPTPNALNDYFDLEYRVEDEDIAQVSRLGVVTAKSLGETTVEVLRRNPKTYVMETIGSFTVKVIEPQPDPTPDPGPTPDPTPEPTPDPKPTPDPEPKPNPEPKPDPEPTPTPAPSPTPTPSSNTQPASTSKAGGSSTSALPKTGDEAVSSAPALLALSAAGCCTLAAGLVLRKRKPE